MSLVSSAPLFAARNSRSGYQIEQSLRFGGGTYLQRTVPLDTSTQDRYVTFSVWFKKATNADNYPQLIEGYRNSTDRSVAWLDFDDTINYRYIGTGTATGSTGKLRDPSAWYHYCVNITSTSTGHEVETFLNGVSVEVQTSSTAYQNYPLWVGGYSGSSTTLRIGTDVAGAGYDFEGYMAEAHLIGGTIYDATKFGEYDASGVWRPIEVTGVNYGDEGWYLKFDPSAANGIGHDHSGNGNNFTASGFTTSGGFTDVMSDTPTNNYATLNAISPLASGTLSNGNLRFSSGAADAISVGTMAVSTGKWYWEIAATTVNASVSAIGIIGQPPASLTVDLRTPSNGYCYISDGNKGNNNTTSAYGDTYASADVIGVALDLDAGTLVFYKNNSSQGTAYSSLSGTFSPAISDLSGVNSDAVFDCNFGQREFAYPPGTYSATQYFNTVTYTGNGSTQSIAGVGFQPDLVWMKRRSTSYNHALCDSVRGTAQDTTLASNLTDTEAANSNGYISSFDSDGFTISPGSSISNPNQATNQSSETYVAWCWKAGGTASSNTAGDITSTVSVNATAGFSIVSYTGNGSSNQTVGHGLGVSPAMIIVKDRDSNATSNRWWVWHQELSSGHNIYIDDTPASFAVSGTTSGGIGGSPSSTTFTLQNGSSNNNNVNESGDRFIAYCFAEVEGYSKFGSYTGNGSVDGPEVNDLGFAPALLAIKRTDSLSEWAVYDSARGNDNQLRWNATDADNTNSAVNVRLTSNGFKIATSDAAQNASGGTYIYMAWARNFSADSDFKSLNTANLPAPTIKDGSDYFNTLLYTGDGIVPRSLTGLGFQPDWVWIKGRSVATWHVLGDSVRGSNGVNGLNLNTNDTAFEGDENSGHVESWDSDGFTVEQADSGSFPLNNVNQNSSTYVAWNWKAGGTASSNTDGTITSTVSANQTAGFSIATYTGNGTAGATIGHGLGVAPSFIITKRRDAASVWNVYHGALGATKVLYLNQTSSEQTDSTVWNNTSPSSTVFTVGTDTNINTNTGTYVAYCFAEVEGYSKFGSYTGNGSTDGPFVYCGFKPAFLIVKRTDTTGNWPMVDAARDPDNVVETGMFANDSLDESSFGSPIDMCDFLSNGFKVRIINTNWNASGGTYIFAAFAEHPFGGVNVSPATAR